MTQRMRIVGINAAKIWVQKYNDKKQAWEQTIMSHEDFEKMMKNEYPVFYRKYENSESNKNAANFFYNYSETDEMKRKGEAFVF